MTPFDPDDDYSSSPSLTIMSVVVGATLIAGAVIYGFNQPKGKDKRVACHEAGGVVLQQNGYYTACVRKDVIIEIK